MKRLLAFVILLFAIAIPAKAEGFTAPQAPESAQKYMPEETSSFGEDLWYVFRSALSNLQPSLTQAGGVCVSIILAVLLISILKNYSENMSRVYSLAGTLCIGLLLLKPADTLIQLGASTITQISEYGKLLLPVMTAAMAAQGATASSAALYTATAFFDSLLSSAITQLLIPLLYVYLCLCVAYSAIGEGILNTLRQFLKWLLTWGLKIILYIFTGYIGITGVVSGATDAAAMKAAKLTISGAVPVVGGILSDASEAILVSAGMLRNSAGIYGLIAIAAIMIGPFLQIAVQYLLLKLTGGVCASLVNGSVSELVKDFSGAMGLILAMTGAVSLLLFISLVCFMRGAG